MTRTPVAAACSSGSVHAVARLAAEHVVADAIGLHAELDLVLAAGAGVDGAVGLEVRARLLVARHLACSVGMLVNPVPCCRFAGTPGIADVVARVEKT